MLINYENKWKNNRRMKNMAKFLLSVNDIPWRTGEEFAGRNPKIIVMKRTVNILSGFDTFSIMANSR